MEDDKIKDLFSSFEPEMPSDFQFMARLRRSMEAVELVKQHNLAMRRRNKKAVVIAALSGFAAGVLLTLLFPLVGDWISVVSISIPHMGISPITIEYQLVAWIVVAIVSVLIAFNVYEIAMSRLASKETVPPARISIGGK